MLSENELTTEVEMPEEKPSKKFKIPKNNSEREDSLSGEETKKLDVKDFSKPPEALAESMQLERMVRFDNTFKMVMAHYKKLMSFSF